MKNLKIQFDIEKCEGGHHVTSGNNALAIIVEMQHRAPWGSCPYFNATLFCFADAQRFTASKHRTFEEAREWVQSAVLNAVNNLSLVIN